MERVAKAVLGEERVSDAGMPVLAAEDFSYFLKQKPGCYFFLGGAEPGRPNVSCHATNFDFNDNLLEVGMRLWIRLVEDRLSVSLFD